MCPDCEVMRTQRSKHCATCNRCVERFDHHCPWINNCVGIHNHNPYLVFILSLILILLLIIISSIVMLSNDCRPDEDPLQAKVNCPLIEFCVGCRNLPLRYIMLTVTVLICMFFGGPAGILVYIHVKNYLAGKTTNERFARAQRAGSMSTDSNRTESQTSINDYNTEVLIERGVPRRRRRGYCSNCQQMCCMRKIKT